MLIATVEWLAVIPAGMILSGRAVAEVDPQGGAELAGALIGGGIVALFTGGLAVVMVFACLIVGIVFFLLGREMQPETQVAPPPLQQAPETTPITKPKLTKETGEDRPPPPIGKKW